MKKMKKVTGICLVSALVAGMMFTGSQNVSGFALPKNSVKGYNISKKSGTYSNKVNVKLKVKKGYKVYYTTGKKLSASNIIRAGKTKKIKFTKTKTLKVYAVKASLKVSAKSLRSVKDSYMKKYTYKIVENTASDSSGNANTVNNGTGSNNINNTADNNTGNGTNGNPSPSGTAGSTAGPDTTAGSTASPDATATPPAATPGNSQYTGDDSLSDYIKPARVQYDDTDSVVTSGNATVINMPSSATGSKVTTDTYEISKKNKLIITSPGTYVIRSEQGTQIDGLIEADYADTASEGTVHIILDGIAMTSSVNTAPTSDTGIITIKKSVTRAVITASDGTVNTLTDTGASGIDKDDSTSTTYTAGIVCKQTPLTINGKGTINIISKNGNGIKCTNGTKIIGTTVNVSGEGDSSTGHNGISSKLYLGLKDANVAVHSNGDGLKITLDENDITEDAALTDEGNIDIDGGAYQVVSENGDGISAYRTLYLNPQSINVVTKNAASSTSDSSYKGIKAGKTIYVPETAGNITVDTLATYNSNNSVWDGNAANADDTIHSNGYIMIDGGTFELASGDDGIHSDTGLVINNGEINISASYEGLESGDITINNGNINITSRDDGINAAGGNDGTTSGGPGGWGGFGDRFNKGESANNTQYQIIINGGTITVDAGGDGIDSNGNIFFKGGTVTVNGPVNSGNGALDYGDSSDCVCEISGGTLIAAGAVGMDVAPTNGSTQPAVNIRLSQSQAADTYVVVKDTSGNVIMEARPTKQFQSVVMSCGQFKLGETYEIYYGSNMDSLTKGDSFTFTSVSVQTGQSTGGWGGPGGQGGSGGNRPF